MKRVPIVFQGENQAITEMARALTMEDIGHLKAVECRTNRNHPSLHKLF